MNNIITFSKGASFRDGNAYLTLGVLILVIIWIVMLTSSESTMAIFTSPVLAHIVLYTLDFNGNQIDLERQLVRTYKIKLWGKVGHWIDFNQYEKVELDYESFKIVVDDFDQDLDDVSSGSKTEIHGHFLVYLNNGNLEEKIVLREELKYPDADKFAVEAANKIQRPYVDKYHLRVQESKRNRRR